MKNLQSAAGYLKQAQAASAHGRGSLQAVGIASGELLAARLSTASVIIYAITYIIFNYSTFTLSYPWLRASGAQALIESVAIVLAFVGLVARCSRLRLAQVLVCCLAVPLLWISAIIRSVWFESVLKACIRNGNDVGGLIERPVWTDKASVIVVVQKRLE